MATPSIPVRVHAVTQGIAPEMQTMVWTTGQTFPLGAVVIATSGQLVVASTTPTTGIVGVVGQGAGTNPGYDLGNSPATFTGRSQTVTVFRPNDSTIFAAQFTNNSSTVIAPAQTDVTVNYGMTVYSGIWTVDKNLTTSNACVNIVGFSLDPYSPGLVFFKFLPAAID